MFKIECLAGHSIVILGGVHEFIVLVTCDKFREFDGLRPLFRRRHASLFKGRWLA